MEVREAVRSRRSVRAFVDRPVDLEVLARVLGEATRAPSGGNLQPWQVVVLTGEALEALRQLVRERLESGGALPPPEYPVYPSPLHSPYRERRFANGEQLYVALGIPREDKMARLLQFARNWDFFGAPVGVLLFVDRRMGAAQWSDLGGYLQTVMLLLRDAGLDSCPQEAWSAQHDLVAQVVDVPEDVMLFCGLAVGYADAGHPVNSFVTDRAPVADVVRVVDRPRV
jgi:nitroreductase